MLVGKRLPRPAPDWPDLLSIFAVLVVSFAAAGPAGSDSLIDLASPNEQGVGQFGFAVAGVPDVTGDLHGDVLVGAPNENPENSPRAAGRAYLFDGRSGELLHTLVSPNEMELGKFGASVSGVLDLNGDGRGDVLVGAVGEQLDIGPSRCGLAHIFDGATGQWLRTFASPNPDFSGQFGCSVSGVPDVNGDGKDDVIVGACAENQGDFLFDQGRAYVFDGVTGSLLLTLTSPNAEAQGLFGVSVSGIPDVNGDGFGDVIVGARNESPGLSPNNAGRAYVFSGATGALLYTLASPTEQFSGFFGASISWVPDLDGDAKPDVVVGAWNEGPEAAAINAGRVHVYSGATGQFLESLVSPNQQTDGRFGFSVSGTDDLDGDGFGDILTGAPYEAQGISPDQAGRAYTFSGATGAPVGTLVSPNEQAQGWFGCSVARVPSSRLRFFGALAVGACQENPLFSPFGAGRAYLAPGAERIIGDPRLFNISTRGFVGAGDSVMIAGFIIEGFQSKRVLATGWGPSLASLGVPNVLPDPVLAVLSGQTVLAANDNWQDFPDQNGIIATGHQPSNPLESAVLLTLGPGAYTAILSGDGATTGNGLVAVWDAGTSESLLTNISTRGFVGAGDNVTIAGFILEGTRPQTVVVTGAGPSLSAFGVTHVLADPLLRVFSGQTQLAVNDDWEDSPDKNKIIAAGRQPLDSRESAVILTLNPGAYTAVLAGAGGGTGNGLIAVWKID